MKDNSPILLIEDDKVDIRLLQRAFKELQVSNPLLVAGNGEEALAWLCNPANDLPGLVLLDLNMPCMNGLEFLAHIRAHQVLRSLSVVVMTTSNQEQDRQQAFDMAIAGYMIKPMQYSELVTLLRTIHQYWITSEPRI